ncbi:UMP-CMP kinase [Coemansia guatemalensis]|uniref:UMP-CMP kinase n=1 Tax=Coemansia guatemalensis TaxID=2761395 RepID=A0A9W8HTN1_9FUNG|nr:UMP-CMP kinase [Coemansia guatemalensis]
MAASSSRIRSDCVVNAPAAVPLKVAITQVDVDTTASWPTGTLNTQTGAASHGETSCNHAAHPMFIGIGGGRGAGKEFTCRNIIDKVRERGFVELAERVVHLHLDDFHRELAPGDRVQMDDGKAEINFDHPESYDFELLQSVLQTLKRGGAVDVPCWNRRQKRREGTRRIECQPRVVLVEGTLVLFVREVRALMDMQVFLDVDSDTRLGRQVRAELKCVASESQEMHEALKRFLDSYLFMAKPSFEEFIWPTKRWADVIIPKGDGNDVAIELIAQRLIDLDHSK